MLRNNRTVTVLGMALTLVTLLLALTVTGAFAGDDTTTPTLDTPENYVSCEPSDIITVSGVKAGETVDFVFQHSTDGISFTQIGFVRVTVPEGATEVSQPFPYSEAYKSGFFRVTVNIWKGAVDDQSKLVTLKGTWKVTCEPPPPPPGDDGCTPGFWRQPHHYDSWVGYTPEQIFNDVFGVGPSTPLGDAVQARGGGENALMRHAVAALLNASSPDVAYAYTTAEVIAMVNDAYANGNFEEVKDQFEEANESFCPLD